MTKRASALEAFLSAVRDALATSNLDRKGQEAIDRIYAAFDGPGLPGSGQTQRLSVVDRALSAALDTAAGGGVGLECAASSGNSAAARRNSAFPDRHQVRASQHGGKRHKVLA